jgi:predicted nuclease with TOPRIM domain
VAELGERVAWVEGKLEEQAMRVDDIRDALRSLEERMDRRFEGLERRFDSLDRKIDSHFKLFLGVVVAAFGTVAGLILRH